MIFRSITPASGVERDVKAVASWMKTFSAKLGPRTPVTFIALSTEEGLRNYIVTPDTSTMNDAALAASHAVSGKLRRIEDPSDIPSLADVNYIGHMMYRPGGARYSATQADSDPFALSESLDQMPVGSWVAVTMRAPYENLAFNETNIFQKWQFGQIKGSTHHSLENNATIAHVAVGTTDPSRAKAIMRDVTGGMPGFDLPVKTVSFPRPRVVMGMLALAVLAAVLGFGAGLLPELVEGHVEEPFSTLVALLSPALYALAAIPVLSAIGYVIWGKRYQRRFASGRFPLPMIRHSLRPPKRPTQDNDHGQMESGESFINAMSGRSAATKGSAGEYPLNRTSFKLGSMLPAGVVAPAAGASSGESETSARRAPAGLLHPIGPLVGRDEEGRKVRLSARDLWAGIAVFGKPRSGKSYLLRAIFAWFLADQTPLEPARAKSPEQAESILGERGAIIAFESKDGEDAAEYQKWSAALGGKKVHVLDLADPESRRIDMFGSNGSPSDRANRFVNKMIYHWGDESIAAASRKTLRNVMMTGLVMPEQVWTDALGQAGEDRPRPVPPFSPVAVAATLLGVYGNEFARVLVDTFRSYVRDIEHGVIADPEGVYLFDSGGNELTDDNGEPISSAHYDDLGYGLSGLNELWGEGVAEGRRAERQKAPVSKIEELMLAPHLWVVDKKAVSFEKILKSHSKIVINSGATSTATGASADDLRLAETTSKAVSAMLLYSLRETIEDVCGGWEAQGRYVVVMSDEVSRVASSSPDVIKWFRMQGRSYGVVPIFATQEPEQLQDDVRSVMFSLSTVMSYAQNNSEVAKSLASDLTGGAESGWEVVSSKEIMDLPKYTVIARTDLDQRRQSVFTALVEPFEKNRAGFRDLVQLEVDEVAEEEPDPLA